MASRIPLPSFPRPATFVDLQRIAQQGRRIVAWRPPRGQALRLSLYRAAWAPFWLGSDIPRPGFRVREEPFPPGGPVGDFFVTELSRLTLRIWIQRALEVAGRAAWLPLLVASGWQALEIAGGPAPNPWLLAGLALLLLPAAILFVILIKPSRRDVARMLDRSFVLQERMVTAVQSVGRGVPEPGQVPSITYLQMADAANVVTELRGHQAFRIRPPVREIVLAIVCTLVLTALFFLRGVGGGVPAAASDPVPAFVPAAERLAQEADTPLQSGAVQADAPTREEIQELAERSSQAQQDLKKLANALRDQAVTRAAAEAIQRGDYAEAAELIRQVAENADQLSPAAREGLADDLDQAADEMSSGGNGLAEAAREAASGLREGGEAAREGMQQLGDSVDRTAADIVSQQELASAMSRAEAAESSDQSSDQAGESGQPEDGSSQRDRPGGASEPQDESGTGGGSSNASEPAGENAGSECAGPGQSGSSAGEQPGEAGSEPGGEESGSQPGGEGASQEADGQGAGQGRSPGESTEGGVEAGQDGPDGEGGDPGPGAGGGGTNEQEAASGGETASGEAGEGDPRQPDVSDGGGASGEGSGEAQDPRSAITLSRAPGEAGIQVGGQGNSASVGSGSGAASGDGSTVQGDVGEAGPDSNHVPAEYRGLVEEYFLEQDGT